MYTIQLLAPFVAGLCFENFMTKQGELCNIRQPPDVVLKYDKQNPKDACYKDGIYYPRCKDLDNPDILYYHNLFKSEVK
jgi:hypothetical protein